MRDKLYLITRIGDVSHEFIPTEREKKLVYDSRLEILGWCLNNGNLRKQEELDTYMSNLSEEIYGYEFAHCECYQKQMAQAKLHELQLFND